MSYIIAIDGPAGSGKGTITKLLAQKLGFLAMDTGAMYRACTVYFLQNNIDQLDEEQVNQAVEDINIDMEEIDGILHIYLNGTDVSKEIRMPEIDKNVSAVCAIPVVRKAMVKQQRKLAEGKNFILEGRDIGTAVFPDAFVKIYLDATPEERARRRLLQNQEKGMLEQSYEEVLQAIKERDYKDSHRELDPLRVAEGAVIVDSTNLTIEQVVETIEKIVKERM